MSARGERGERIEDFIYGVSDPCYLHLGLQNVVDKSQTSIARSVAREKLAIMEETITELEPDPRFAKVTRVEGGTVRARMRA